MEYFICIPSYKRSRICNTKTLKTLSNLGISKNIINVFVIEEEFNEYKQTLDPTLYDKLIIGVKGLVYQREFIENYFQVGSKLIMIDDDIEGLDLSLTSYSNVDDFIKDAFMECAKENAFIWSIYPVFNKFFREKRQHLTSHLNYMVGCFYGIITRQSEDLKLLITREGNKEDVERSILYWLKDRKTLRYNRIAAKTKYYGTDGGGLGKLKDRIEYMKDYAIKINNRYPKLTKIKIRKNGLYEIVFKTNINNFEPLNNDVSILKPLPYDDELLQTIFGMLENITIPLNTKKHGRAISFGSYRGMVLGVVKSRITRKFGISAYTKKFPELYEAIKMLGKRIVPFDFNCIQVNYNVVCPKHLDKNNVENSVLISFGDYEGCDLEIENKGIFNTNCKPIMFNGSNLYHWNTPLIRGNKYSLVYFNSS